MSHSTALSLNENRDEEIAEIISKIKQDWKEKNLPRKIAGCISLANKIFRVDFLPDGIKMFFRNSTILLDILFQANPHYHKLDDSNWWDVSEFLETELRNVGGDFIVHYCENTRHDKRARDRLMQFSVVLELFLRKEEIVQDMVYTVNAISPIVPITSQSISGSTMKISVLKYLLAEIEESLLSQTLDKLERLGFHETSDGLGVIRQMFIV